MRAALRWSKCRGLARGRVGERRVELSSLRQVRGTWTLEISRAGGRECRSIASPAPPRPTELREQSGAEVKTQKNSLRMFEPS